MTKTVGVESSILSDFTNSYTLLSELSSILSDFTNSYTLLSELSSMLSDFTNSYTLLSELRLLWCTLDYLIHLNIGVSNNHEWQFSAHSLTEHKIHLGIYFLEQTCFCLIDKPSIPNSRSQ